VRLVCFDLILISLTISFIYKMKSLIVVRRGNIFYNKKH